MFRFRTIFIGDVNFPKRWGIFALTCWSDWLIGISMGNSIFIHHNVTILEERLLIGNIENGGWFCVCRGLKVADRSHVGWIFVFHVERCGSILIFVWVLELPILFDVYSFTIIQFFFFFSVCLQILARLGLIFGTWTSTFLYFKRVKILK